MTFDLCAAPQGRGGGRAPGEDTGAEQRQDGQERGEVCRSVRVREKQPATVADERNVSSHFASCFIAAFRHFDPDMVSAQINRKDTNFGPTSMFDCYFEAVLLKTVPVWNMDVL